MSASVIDEEDVVIVPWIGSKAFRKSISVALLNANEDPDQPTLHNALISEHIKQSNSWELRVLRAPTLAVLNNVKHLSIDFVVALLDLRSISCIEWAQEVVMQTHPELRLGRLVFVNTTNCPKYSIGPKVYELIALRQKYRVDVISGNVYDFDDCQFLANHLLTHIKTVLGLNTGVPNVNLGVLPTS